MTGGKLKLKRVIIFIFILCYSRRKHVFTSLREILKLAEVYKREDMHKAFSLAISYSTYSVNFIRGILEKEGRITLLINPIWVIIGINKTI